MYAFANEEWREREREDKLAEKLKANPNDGDGTADHREMVAFAPRELGLFGGSGWEFRRNTKETN